MQVVPEQRLKPHRSERHWLGFFGFQEPEVTKIINSVLGQYGEYALPNNAERRKKEAGHFS
jgi:hypothetical protein